MRSPIAGPLALAWLTGCAATPATRETLPPPDLAAIVAPEPVRSEMVGALTALLAGSRVDLLLPMGDETVRCQVGIAPSQARATCDGIVEEAPDVATLVRKLHTGDWMQRLVQSRLDDTHVFVARTGLTLEACTTEVSPPAELSVRCLGPVLGWTRFSVGERGTVVRATFTSLDGPETIGAGSLFALVQKLRARQEELIAERESRARDARERDWLESTLQEVDQTPAGRWGVHGIGRRPDDDEAASVSVSPPVWPFPRRAPVATVAGATHGERVPRLTVRFPAGPGRGHRWPRGSGHQHRLLAHPA